MVFYTLPLGSTGIAGV